MYKKKISLSYNGLHFSAIYIYFPYKFVVDNHLVNASVGLCENVHYNFYSELTGTEDASICM